jgi:hypothetical protein
MSPDFLRRSQGLQQHFRQQQLPQGVIAEGEEFAPQLLQLLKVALAL